MWRLGVGGVKFGAYSAKSQICFKLFGKFGGGGGLRWKWVENIKHEMPRVKSTWLFVLYVLSLNCKPFTFTLNPSPSVKQTWIFTFYTLTLQV